MASSTRRELEALKREVDALRAERRDALAGAASQFGVDAAEKAEETAGEPGFVVDWDELKQLAEEIADELGKATREHPTLGIAGAFVLGLLVGRTLSR